VGVVSEQHLKCHTHLPAHPPPLSAPGSTCLPARLFNIMKKRFGYNNSYVNHRLVNISS
jgi:hypothetical protein